MHLKDLEEIINYLRDLVKLVDDIQYKTYHANVEIKAWRPACIPCTE